MTLKKLAADNGGATLVEFAFALPVLIMIMIGTLQFALVMQASGAMRHGIGEGLRYAKVNGVDDPDDPVEVAALKAKVEEVARDALTGINLSNIKSLEFSRGTDNGAEYGRIDMEYEMETVIPFTPGGKIDMNESRTVYLPA